MASVETYTKAGLKASTPAKLDKSVFGVKATPELLKQAYVAYMSNSRTNLAKTKARGEVRGGGRKPWRQKGTGRARFGSSRVPIWRGGGITFGPTGAENYSKHLTSNTKKQALRQALSLAAKDGSLKIIESISVADGKSATAAKLIAKMELTGHVLLVANKDSKLKQAVNNLNLVTLINPSQLNTYTVMNADALVITSEALNTVQDNLGGKKS